MAHAVSGRSLISSATRSWTNDPSIAARVPLLLCLGYCFGIFYLKAAAHAMFEIPHVDEDYVAPFIAEAIWQISISLLPVMCLLLVAPISKPTTIDAVDENRTKTVVWIAIGLSLLVVAIVVAQRGGAALIDVYGNRLLVEHGILAPLTIAVAPFIFSTTIVLAASKQKRPFVPVAVLCLIWGVFLAKGFMLVYPMALYVFIRFSARRGFIILGTVSMVLGLAVVVVLGRLRSGSDLSELANDDGFHVMLALFLSRIDQLDSLALILSQKHLEYSLSLWDEIVKSILYLVPRELYPEKSLSFSMEMTRSLRPLVYANDAANNFTLFSQAFLIAGQFGVILSSVVLLFFFYGMGVLQRLLFPSNVGYWAFSFSILIPSFMSLISSGIFHEYVILQIMISLPGLLAFKYFSRAAK